MCQPLCEGCTACNWQTSARAWLERCSNEAFEAWRKTKRGKQWTDNDNPYHMGFTLADWHYDCIDALNKNDEESFKAIKLIHGPAGYGYGKADKDD